MIVYWKLFCQCLIILSVTCSFCACIEPSRNELMRYLLEEAEYDHNFPPSTENVTDVSVQLYITDFNSESDKDREIEFTLYLRMNWTDPRLDFTRNNTTYDVIKFGDDIVDSLWMPDLYFLNERKSQLHGLFEKNQLAYIYKNGSVFYSGRFNIRLHCVMNFDKYPFDTQRCPIEIQSYAYSTDHVLLHWYSDHAVKIDPSTDSYKLKIPSQGQSIETRNTYPITGEFSTLRTEIQIPRPKGSYDMMITVPSIILVVTALTSFLLGDNITPRIGVPTGTLISLFVQWSGTYSRLSLDSTSKYLDKWMCVHLGFLGFILLVNACICHFKYKVDKDKKDRKRVRCCKRSAIATKAEPSFNQVEGDNIPLHTKDNPNYQATVPRSKSVNDIEEDSVTIPADNSTNASTSETDMNQKFHETKENLNSDERYKRAKNLFGEKNLEQIFLKFVREKFHETKENLNSDERYKRAKNLFGEKKLEQIFLKFVREKTENYFYNLLEENESTILVQESKKGICECCDWCATKIEQCNNDCGRCWKECKEKECCIILTIRWFAQKINTVSCITIFLVYIIVIVAHKTDWTSS